MQLKTYISSSVYKKDFNKVRELAEQLNTGIEISRFYDFYNIDDNYEKTLNEMKNVFSDFKQGLTVHAFFFNLSVVSRDKAIKEISIRRSEQSLRAALELKAETLVFHTGFNAFLKHNDSKKLFTENYIIFWKDFIKNFEKENLIAVLENVQEHDPDFINNIIKEVNSPNLKASIDTGHANIHSKLPVVEWIKGYNKNLHHMHLHNNFGDDDSHNSLLKGNIDFEEILKTLKNNNLTPQIVFEIFDKKSIIESVEYFNEISKKLN